MSKNRPEEVRVACSVCDKADSCVKSKDIADACYQRYYNKTRRNKIAEQIRQALIRKRYFERYMFYKTKHMAKKAGLDFDLSVEWFKEQLERGTCEVTNLPFIKPTYQPGKRGRRGPYTPSVDRIDNSKGYTESNCRMVIWMANLAKNSYSDVDLARLCKAFTATELSQQL